MAIAISRALHDELIARAAAEPDFEVCGLLFGTGERIEAIQPCRNVSPSPADTFEIDPIALIAAHKAERVGGPRVVGCYHSHPNGLSALSGLDRKYHIRYNVWLVIAGWSISAWGPDAISLTVCD